MYDTWQLHFTSHKILFTASSFSDTWLIFICKYYKTNWTWCRFPVGNLNKNYLLFLTLNMLMDKQHTWIDTLIIWACVHTFVMWSQGSTLIFHSCNTAFHPLQFTVQEKSTKTTWYWVVCQKAQIVVIKLEGQWELFLDLLNKNNNRH